jgi:DNA polymerase III subunit gamma/tau
MSYTAMARRYRPQRFADVAAQSHVTETLKSALSGKRPAASDKRASAGDKSPGTGDKSGDRVAAAYLFAGPRGSGKTTVARILAKAVNCPRLQGGEPCGECDTCKSIAEGRSLDVLEIDGASNNSVDDVRELRENVRYAASEPGKRKVYIIDEVHMLSAGAFNALLKTLEEPPSHVLFVFATTEPRKVPQTILSRCQRFDFRRLQSAEILERLQDICKREKVDIEPAALFVIAKRADGSLRDGLSLLDQVISSTSGRIREPEVARLLGLVRDELYLDLGEAILAHDPVRGLGLLHQALGEGADPSSFALGLVEHLRNLLLLSVDAGLQKSVQLGDAELERAQELARRFRTEDLLFLLNRAAAVYEETRTLGSPSVVLEAAIVELARFESRVVLSEVLQRLGEAPRGPGGAPSAGGGGQDTERQPRRPAPAAPARGRTGTARGADGSAVAPGTPAIPTPATGAPAITAPVSPALPGPAPGPTGTDFFAAGGPFTAPRARAVDASGASPAPPRPGSAAVGAPAAAPGVASAAVGAPAADLESIAARWNEFTQVVRGSKAMLAQCLSEGVPVRLDGEALELEFQAGQSFQVHWLEEAVTRADLEEQLEAYFGRRFRVRVRESGTEKSELPPRLTDADIAASRRAAVEDIVQRTPNLQDILDAFDGEILEDREA